jgi:hypothetical protein
MQGALSSRLCPCLRQSRLVSSSLYLPETVCLNPASKKANFCIDVFALQVGINQQLIQGICWESKRALSLEN